MMMHYFSQSHVTVSYLFSPLTKPQVCAIVVMNNLFLCHVLYRTFMNSLIFCVNLDGVDHKLITKHEAHKRIIWACSWNPFKHEFATGSRDKTVKIWSVDKDSSSVNLLSTLPQFRDSVTALSWAGYDQSKCAGLLAVGMDNGLIEVWNVTSGNLEVPAFSASCAIRFDPFLCHVSTVYRLRWREVDGNESAVGVHQLASCGADHSVRVFDVHVK